MVIYISIATLLFLGCFVKIENTKYIRSMFVVLFLFTALHNPYITGTDGISYRYFFDNFVPTLSSFGSYHHTYEIGYALLNSIAKTIKNDYFVFQALYCLISTVLLAAVVNKTGFDNKEKCLLLFVYFCFRYFQNSMEFLRQNIAILLIWYALLCFNQDNDNNVTRIKQFLTMGVAWLFHRSALFNFLIYPVVQFMRRKSASILLIITAILSAALLSIGTPIINRMINFAVAIGGERYSGYFIDGEIVIGLNWINYCLRWFFLLIFSYGINCTSVVNDTDETVYSSRDGSNQLILALSSLAIICGSINVGIFTRMLEYYMIGIYMSIVRSRDSFRDGASKNIYTICIYVAFIIILIRNLHTISGGTYLNYELYPFNQ